MILSETKYLMPTLKENPAEAEIVSHQLMIRGWLYPKTFSRFIYIFALMFKSHL